VGDQVNDQGGFESRAQSVMIVSSHPDDEINQKLLRMLYGSQGGHNRSPPPGAFLEKSPVKHLAAGGKKVTTANGCGKGFQPTDGKQKRC
jgi:hypothetical protein